MHRERDGALWRHRLEQECHPFGREGVAWMLERIKDDLLALGSASTSSPRA
jgi:hypothetical protein